MLAAVPGQLSFALGGEAVVLNRDDGAYYELNELGARIWSLLLRQPRPVGEIVEAVLAEYEVDAGPGRRYVEAFLNDLIAHRLVVCRDVSEPALRNGQEAAH